MPQKTNSSTAKIRGEGVLDIVCNKPNEKNLEKVCDIGRRFINPR